MNQNKSQKRLWIAGGVLLLIAAATLTLSLWMRNANQDAPAESFRAAQTKFDPHDQDSDGLKDDYELTFFHHVNESADADKDGLPDKLETRLYNSLSRGEDTDKYGLPDAWELTYFGNLAQAANGDPDGDGLTNIQELARGRGYNPARHTKVVAWKDAKASANVSGAASIAGVGKRAADGKIYYQKTYDRLVKSGKFTTPWEQLK